MPRTVLIIEDNEQNLYLATRLLEAAGYRVIAAHNGPEGIALAAQSRPDLILLDIQLPRMDGFEVARRLREEPNLRAVPIVAVTSYAMVGDRERILAAGCNGYLEKPIDPATFQSEVAKHLPPSSQRQGKGITVLIVEDNEAARYQLQVLLGAHQYRVITAVHGAEALAKAREQPPDLVISDILMPVMDGFALCREWMKDERLRGIPFVFYTATYTDDQDRQFALGLGAAQFVVKPEDPEVLINVIRDVLANCEAGRLAAGRPVITEEQVYLKEYNEALIRKLEAKMDELTRDIAARQRAEAELRRVDRALRTISECNRILVRATDKAELLQQLCRVAVEQGGYRFAWVGFAELDAAKTVRPVAHAGFEEGYLQAIKVTWDDSEYGRNPTGTAIRTGAVCAVRNIASDPRFARYRAEALRRGYASELVLPLREDNRTFGALSLYAAESDAFTAEETELLSELADDLAYGIVALRTRAARRKAEATVIEQGRLIELAHDAIIVRDLDGRIQFANPAAERLSGYSLAEARGQRIQELAHRDPARYEAAMRQLLATGEWQGELTMLTRSGRELLVHSRWTLLRDAEGKPKSVLSISTDITERRLAQEALRLRDSALEASANAILITDVEGKIVWVNPAFHRLTGYARDEALGQNPRLLKSGRHDRAFYENLWQTIRAGRVWQGEMINRHKDGHLYTEEMTITPVADGAGRITHFIAVKQDVTARKEAEENLRAQARLLDLAQDAIVVRDMDGRVRYWNQSCERLTGFTAAETLDRPCNELVQITPALYEQADRALRQHGHWSGELTLARKDGSHVTIMSRWTLVRDGQGQPKSVLVINTDMTEQKQLEAQVHRAQRLEAIGALASGVAHDLNNILTPILMMAPLLHESVADEDSRRMVDTLESCAQRGADIIKQLLLFARGTPGTRIVLPVSRMLRDMGKLIQETFPRDISPVVDAPKDLWPVQGDPTQFHQVLMNLCVNARDAMPDGGTLSLSAQNVAVDETFADMVLDAQPGDYVCIRVRDTGQGIAPEHLERIFDPFFTTKEAGKGTGLGLATVLGIVRGHKGFVRVDSQVGSGTTFELYFPATPEAQISPASAQRPPPPRGQGERILVVDDEAGVRDSVRHTLERHGYRVITAAEGNEGVDAFTRHTAEIRAVLTDMMMPVMKGPALIAALRKLRPDLVVLGMTGLTEREMVKGQGELEVAALLTKPFTSEELLRALHAALAPAEKPAPPPSA